MPRPSRCCALGVVIALMIMAGALARSVDATAAAATSHPVAATHTPGDALEAAVVRVLPSLADERPGRSRPLSHRVPPFVLDLAWASMVLALAITGRVEDQGTPVRVRRVGASSVSLRGPPALDSGFPIN